MTTKIVYHASDELIREWDSYISVGIWDRCHTSIRLYADRAVYKTPYVHWRNNSGSLDVTTRRVTGTNLRSLLRISREEIEDGVDYTDLAFELLSGCVDGC